jgi:hypothetical protein
VRKVEHEGPSVDQDDCCHVDSGEEVLGIDRSRTTLGQPLRSMTAYADCPSLSQSGAMS